LLALPAFLVDAKKAAGGEDLAAALRLTAHFLNQWVLAPQERQMPQARRRLGDFAGKKAVSPQNGESD
jgi:DNA repair protein RecO (recombination protein O)